LSSKAKATIRLEFHQLFETVADYDRIKGIAVPANEQKFDRLQARMAKMA
jgi:hypothetical protein